jgi:hypothetical protein
MFLFAGKGADDIGIQLGVDVVPNTYFHDSTNYVKWLKSNGQNSKEKLLAVLHLINMEILPLEHQLVEDKIKCQAE